MDDAFRFHPDNPFRRPDGRWLRACYIHKHHLRLGADDDAVVREAVRFLRTRDRWRVESARLGIARQSLVPTVYTFLNEVVPGGPDHKKIVRSYNAVVMAHRIYVGHNALLRGEVQGRLLAGESDAAIATKCGLSETAVATYAALFFDVRQSLRADSYIVGVVLRAKPHCGFDPRDHCGILSFIGYRLGSKAIDVATDTFRQPPVVPASLDSFTLPEMEELRQKLTMKLLILTLTRPADKVSPKTWLQARPTLATAASDTDTFGPLRAAVDAASLLRSRPSRHVEVEPMGEVGMEVEPVATVRDQVMLPIRAMLHQQVTDLWRRELVAA